MQNALIFKKPWCRITRNTLNLWNLILRGVKKKKREKKKQKKEKNIQPKLKQNVLPRIRQK